MSGPGSGAGRSGEGTAARPKVSVALITYNQERFIAQALEGVLMQQTRATFEVVVGEDCSTDGTARVIAAFQERYPGRLEVLPTPRNLGMIANLVRTLRACRGEYVALLEGDDYWTDPAKLQRQVEFLDGHPGCTVCFHDAEVRFEDAARPPKRYCPPGLKEISTLEDLLRVNFIPTCSAMFRNGLVREFPDWFHTLDFGDWPLHLLNARHGDIGYVAEPMAVYRMHSGGAWGRLAERRRRLGTIRFCEHVDAWLGREFHGTIQELVGEEYYRLARLHERRGRRRAARLYMARGFRAKPLNRRIRLGWWLRLLARVCIPGLGRQPDKGTAGVEATSAQPQAAADGERE
jgi:glycosyltransferase involved in cell wall biosynthesis